MYLLNGMPTPFWADDNNSVRPKKAPIDNGRHIDNQGTVRIYKDKKLHCINGPAVIGKRGYKQYMINDKLHREDGPAIIYADGSKRYYLNNIEIDESEYLKVLNCPLRDLPLLLGSNKSELEPIVKKRLKEGL